ncbi:Mitotic-spindle organizing protein 1 [Cryptotermes secundus]|uniref:Mitotic-spindle organizing protein 1 n=1 Tax=Cryptotermes secundus TaxID=105785 RepID=A0A2J7PX59_9NEOP|nr:Mitotic-spindle organizing protein 1 [Cryptotermes secundus]
MAHSGSSQVCEAREVFHVLLEISRLLNTGLDPETLSICIQLCERGTSPEALANVVNEIRREVTAISRGDEKQDKYYS